MKKFNIALDGPSGVGKSSAADGLAARYGLTHIDTGAMYRAIALGMQEKGIEPKESRELTEALNGLEVKLEGDQIFLNGNNVSSQIRTPLISNLASVYSAIPSVRRKLVALQQEIASEKGYILDGRDICDVVLPDAEVKIYLDASAQARAMRRYLQDKNKGLDVDYEDVLSQIQQRDEQDRTRAVSPLKISADAEVIDSSELNLEQTIEALAAHVEKTLQKGAL